jgi:hypothetical protein
MDTPSQRAAVATKAVHHVDSAPDIKLFVCGTGDFVNGCHKKSWLFQAKL